jgi:hypothetical protein
MLVLQWPVQVLINAVRVMLEPLLLLMVIFRSNDQDILQRMGRWICISAHCPLQHSEVRLAHSRAIPPTVKDWWCEAVLVVPLVCLP